MSLKLGNTTVPLYLGLLPTTELGDVVYLIETQLQFECLLQIFPNKPKHVRKWKKELRKLDLLQLKGANCLLVSDLNLEKGNKELILSLRKDVANRTRTSKASSSTIENKRKAEASDNQVDDAKRRKVDADKAISSASTLPSASTTIVSPDSVTKVNSGVSDPSLPTPITIQQIEEEGGYVSCIFCADDDGSRFAFEYCGYYSEDYEDLCDECAEEVDARTCQNCLKLFMGSDEDAMPEWSDVCCRCARKEACNFEHEDEDDSDDLDDDGCDYRGYSFLL